MSDLKTCRFCHLSNYDHKHPNAKSAWVRTGTRHNAHLTCGVEKQGAAFIRKLMTHQIEALPFMELRDLDMVAMVREELACRAQMHPQAQASRNAIR